MEKHELQTADICERKVIPSRFSRVSFGTEKLNQKHREVFYLMSFIPDKEEFSFIWVQFQFRQSMTEQRLNMAVNY